MEDKIKANAALSQSPTVQTVGVRAGALSSSATPAPTAPVSRTFLSEPNPAGFSRFVKRFAVVMVLLFVLGLGGILAYGWLAGDGESNDTGNVSGEFSDTEIPLADLPTGESFDLGASSLTINGPLRVNDTFVLAPQSQPVQAVAGQLYFDQTTSALTYYNGTDYVALQGNNVVSVASGSSNVTVTNNNGNIVISAVTSAGGTGTVTSPGGSSGRIAKFTGVQSLEDSLLSESGSTITVNGSLSVTGSLGLGSPLTVSNGGTGATTLATNGVVVANGTAALTSVTAGGAGLCLVSTAGAPAFSACPGGSATAFEQGGNSFGAPAVLGTNDGFGLNFEVNTTTVMTISTVGAVNLKNQTNSVNAFRIQNAAASADIFNVDTTNQRVGVGGTASFSKFEVQGGDAAIYNDGNNPRLIIGDSTSAGQNGFLMWDSANNYLRLETTGTNGLKVNDNYLTIGNLFPDQPLKVANGTTLLAQVSTTGELLLQNSSNSTQAVRVLNAAGQQLINVSSVHNTSDVITNGSVETNTTGWVAKGGAAISRITSQQYIGQAALQVDTSAAIGDGARYNVTLSSSTQYTVQFWLKLSSGTFTNMAFGYASDGVTETDCKTSQTVKTGGWSVFNCTFTTGTVSGTPYFYWEQAGATARTVYVDALQMVPGADIGAFYEGKIDISGMNFSGPVAIQNDNDSQASFQIQSANGTTLFGVDTLNKRVGVNLIQATATFHVTTLGTTSVTALFNQSGSSTQDILQLSKSNDTTVAVAHSGATTFQNLTDSTTAFRVLSFNATFGSGVPQFVVDTSNSRVYIGNPTGDTTGALLVLDTKTGSGDPTGVAGGMYYNSNAGKFRCYENGAWKNCLGLTQNLTLFGLNGNGAASGWTNMPASETEFMVGVSGIGVGANRIRYDFTDAAQIRFQVNVESAGSTNAEIRIQYSTDQSTWNYLDNAATGLGQNISTTGLKISSWSDIASGAKGDVYLRLVGINGNGVANPDFGLIQLQVR